MNKPSSSQHDIATSSPLARANLGLRFVLEVALFAGIIVASIQGYDGTTVWIASITGTTVAAGFWGIFAVPGDPSRSGKTIIATPGMVRLAVEIGLFATVAVWLITAESYLFGGLLGGGTVVHYALWPARIRWLLSN